MKKLIGIGNALTDYLVLQADDILDRFGFIKGSTYVVDSETQNAIQELKEDYVYTLSLGGSTANTIRAMAQMGVPVGYIGKVGRDYTGRFFEESLRNLGIKPYIFYGQEASGKCLAFVSADGERTMITCLGAATELNRKEITPEIFNGYDYLYIEGYQVQNTDTVEHVMQTAKKAGLKIAMDLADHSVVSDNRELLHELADKYIDILFANTLEAEAFTGESKPINALNKISKICEIAVVKAGIRGSYVKHGCEVIHTGILAASRRVDTTGVGDFYAAGFLAGLCEELSLRQCATMGAIAAGKVIEVVGTTFGDDRWQDIMEIVKKVKTEKFLL